MRSSRFALVVLLVLGALAASALAHGDNGFIAQNSKDKSGPWKDITQDVTIPSGEKKNVYVRIRNTTAHKLETVTLTESSSQSPPDYHQTWFRGKDDVSHDVQTSGYDFNLKAGKTKKFRIKVDVADDSSQQCLFGDFHVDPQGDDLFTGFRINGTGICII